MLLTCTNKFSLFNVTSDFDHQYKETGVEDYWVANNEDIKICTFKTTDNDVLLKMKLRMMAGGAFEDIQIVSNKNRMLEQTGSNAIPSWSFPPSWYYLAVILPVILFILVCGGSSCSISTDGEKIYGACRIGWCYTKTCSC